MVSVPCLKHAPIASSKGFLPNSQSSQSRFEREYPPHTLTPTSIWAAFEEIGKLAKRLAFRLSSVSPDVRGTV